LNCFLPVIDPKAVCRNDNEVNDEYRVVGEGELFHSVGCVNESNNLL
jgi:hypothetical protein